MVFSDTTNRQNGLIQRCEQNCGLGDTGISGNTILLQQFTGWMNQWNKTGASIAIMSFDGHDFDDPNYTTAPTGTFVGTTNRDYNFDSSVAMLKIKEINVTYDGTNYVPATPFDDNDRRDIAVNDPNVDTNFTMQEPKYDLTANGFKLYPLFTAAQVTAGAKVYVEFYRAPRDFTPTGNDTYTPGFDLQFHHLPAVGASWEYCKLYKPEMAANLQGDLYGARTARGLLIRTGLLDDMKNWYNSKSPSNARLTMFRRVKI